MVNPFVFLGLLRGVPPTSRSATPTSSTPTCTRSCLPRRACGPSLESVLGCIAEPGSTTSRAGWSWSAWWSAASSRLRAWRCWNSRGRATWTPRFLVGLRRAPRHLDSVGAGGCRGGGAARAHGPSRRGQTRRALQHRVPDVHRAVCSLLCSRAVLARQLALQLSVVPGSLGGGAAAVPRDRPALVLGARGACAAPARSGAGGVPADAGAPRPARRRGGHPGGGVGRAGGESSGPHGGLDGRRPAGAVAGRSRPGSCCWCLRTASGC